MIVFRSPDNMESSTHRDRVKSLNCIELYNPNKEHRIFNAAKRENAKRKPQTKKILNEDMQMRWKKEQTCKVRNVLKAREESHEKKSASGVSHDGRPKKSELIWIGKCTRARTDSKAWKVIKRLDWMHETRLQGFARKASQLNARKWFELVINIQILNI